MKRKKKLRKGTANGHNEKMKSVQWINETIGTNEKKICKIQNRLDCHAFS